MSEAVKDYIKFNVLGISEDLVSKEDKKAITTLTKRLDKFKKLQVNPNTTTILIYPIETQLKIFNELKKRQGSKTRITFINSSGRPVEIISARERRGEVVLKCVFCISRTPFRMYLKTFVDEVRVNKITKVKPDKFTENYLVSVNSFIKKTEAELNEIYARYNKVYKDTQNALHAKYDAEIAKYSKIHKQVRSEKRELTTEEALEKAKSFKGLDRIKDYWNSKITEEEKETLLNWISQNIYSIRVYGLSNGQSGNTLLNEYPDAGNIKYRDVKLDQEGRVISQDSIVAHISFKQVLDAPIEILKKVVSTKGRNENIFCKNRLNDKNLALFLLSEYHDKGFKAGVRNLYQEIK